jgi:hypothetical protein
MQLQGNDDPSGTQLEPAAGDDDESPTCQTPTAETELGLYDDDDIATAPWPPPG